MSNISVMTPSQQAVFDEATRRLDKHISFDADDGQYVMKTGLTAAKVGLSKRLFDYFQRNFEATNQSLHQAVSKGFMTIETSPNCVKVINRDDDFDVLTRSFMDDEFDIEGGGMTHTETTWWGYRVYLSNSDLRNISSAAQLTTIICGASSGAAAPFTIPAGTITAVTAWIADGAADKHPDGVIVNIPQFGAPSYVPQSALPR